ncbi:cereblon family protein, partial [Desulfobacterales bacterium HSG16]|nr:cereblon family protein [Desulfobacterales bacterium HSG16]
HIGCFSAAFGCARSGVPTSEYTWFAGFSWCFAMCSKCQIHLGWHFLAEGDKNFYGLILNQLVEGSIKKD